VDQFVIRLWAPAPSVGDAPEEDPGMRGVVSHVPTGRSETFRDGRELLRRLIDLRGPILPPAEVLGAIR
jgi:hypothetical protein